MPARRPLHVDTLLISLHFFSCDICCSPLVPHPIIVDFLLLVHVVVHLSVLVLRVLLFVLFELFTIVIATLIYILVISFIVDRRLPVEIVIVVLIPRRALTTIFWWTGLVIFVIAVPLLRLLL